MDRITAENEDGDVISTNVPSGSCQVGETITIEDNDQTSTYEITQVDKK